MITPSVVYWVATVDRIAGFCAITAGLSLVSLLLLWFAHFQGLCENVDGARSACRELRRVVRIALLVCVTTTVVAIFLPSSKTLAAMYVIPAIANNEKIRDVGNQLYDLAVEWMNELRPGKKGGGK